jgi:hypothetical protein
MYREHEYKIFKEPARLTTPINASPQPVVSVAQPDAMRLLGVDDRRVFVYTESASHRPGLPTHPNGGFSAYAIQRSTQRL